MRARHQALAQRAATAEAKLYEVRIRVNELDPQAKTEVLARASMLEQRLQAALAENATLRDALERYDVELRQAYDRIDALETTHLDMEEEARQRAAELDEERRKADELRTRALVGSVAIDTIDNLRHTRLLRGRRFGPKVADCSLCGCSELHLGRDTQVVVPAPFGKVQVFSQHPVGSYRKQSVSQYQTVIEILRPADFWRHGHCLVIGY